MNTNNLLVIGGVIIMAGILVFVLTTVTGTPTNSNINKETNNELQSIITGTTENGDVAIELKPHMPTGGELSVDVSINTHSVDLSSFDLTKITTLEYKGNTIKPISAPSLGGHHVSGTMVFSVKEMPENFVIKIDGIPAVQERIFKW